MTVAIVDSCSYFLLGKSLHPLLGRQFGPEKLALVALSEVEREFQAKPALEPIYPWVLEECYCINRASNGFPLAGLDLKAVMDWRQQIHDFGRMQRNEYHRAGCNPPSSADSLVLAYAVARNEQCPDVPPVAVVSDDKGIGFTATQLELCQVFKGHQVLTTMESDGTVTTAQLRSTFGYLSYIGQLHSSWAQARPDLLL